MQQTDLPNEKEERIALIEKKGSKVKKLIIYLFGTLAILSVAGILGVYYLKMKHPQPTTKPGSGKVTTLKEIKDAEKHAKEILPQPADEEVEPKEPSPQATTSEAEHSQPEEKETQSEPQVGKITQKVETYDEVQYDLQYFSKHKEEILDDLMSHYKKGNYIYVYNNSKKYLLTGDKKINEIYVFIKKKLMDKGIEVE